MARSRKKGSLAWATVRVVLWTLLGLSVATIIGLGLIGGTSDMHRGAAQDALAYVTGHDARIGELKRLTFFPTVAIEVADVTLTPPGAAEGAAPVATLGRGAFAMGFFDLVFQRGRIQAFEVESLKLSPGLVTPRPVRVTRAVLVGPAEAGGPGALDVRGFYGPHPFTLEIAARVAGDPGLEVFALPDPLPVVLGVYPAGATDTAAPIARLSATLGQGLGDRMIVRDMVLKNAAGVIASSKKFDVAVNGQELKTTGDLVVGESDIDRTITLDWSGARPSVTGKVTAGLLRVQDMQTLAALAGELATVWTGDAPMQAEPAPGSGAAVGGAAFAGLKAVDADVKIAIGTLETLKGFALRDATARVEISAGRLEMPFAAKVSEGALEGLVDIDAVQVPAAAQISATLADWDYAQQLAGDVVRGGVADMRLALSARGDDAAALRANLAGELVIVAGPAELGAPLPGSFAMGFVRAAVPRLGKAREDLRITCAVGDFAIDGGVATARALFLDGAHVTLKGKGSYDIGRDRLNLQIAPRSKNPELLDVAPAVNVTGPLAAPRFTPDAAGAAFKLGGIAVGTMVNPAIGAALLTDMGQGGADPCAEYLEEAAQPPAQ